MTTIIYLNNMKLDNLTVLITGTNRGIGLAFEKTALAGRTRNVYANTRDPLDACADDVLADEMTQQVKLRLSAHPGVYLQARG